MPSTSQGGPQRQRRRFDDEHADEAARWLDWDLLQHDDREEILWSLIDGMDSLDRVRAWRAAERRLAAEDGREPRAKVMQRLDQREEWLELHGERPDRLTFGPRRSCDCCDDDGLTAAEVRERRHEQRERASSGRSSSYESPTRHESGTSTSSLADFATDGGEDQ
ncbi:hypothetical protein [Halomicrobium salinisoli]|uniref:hypothetical protein n=1 Tax=Halomicrobium salinisoli TaxID=2878391 RepID=UPI001CF0AE3D|nr:hypothetical protein [Halomicrobium salinisoli]